MSKMTQTSLNLTLNSQLPKNPTIEYFKEITRDSSIKLASNDGPNVINQEQALVVRDIEKALETADDLTNSIDKFIRGFKVLIKKEKYLKKALLPTLFKKPNNQDNLGASVEIQQESLFRIFLKVTQLQKEIIEIILDEITSTISDDDQDASTLRLLLSQLRYLPHIKDPENLTTKLLDMIDVASYPSQLEILDSIPEILPDSEYNETAKELSKMLDKNDNLCGAIIDCLNALNLSTEIRTQIQDHILSKMLTGGSTVKNFPIFLDFLMSGDTKNLPGMLVKIRNALNSVMSSEDRNDKEKESAKIVIFNRLQKAATSKMISEGWLTVISSIKSHTDHKPIDLIILFMLHSSAKLKKRSIEMTFRKRVKDGQFKCTLLEQLFEKYLPPQLLRDYFTSIVEVGSSLLRTSNDATVTEFASTLFKCLFSHEYTDRTFRQEILENMILLVGASDQKNVSVILNILIDLSKDIAKTPNHANILMRLLEKLDTFELKNVKLIFEILCSLTCSDETLITLKEELHMIVRKHLSSSKRMLKHRGIISAVVMTRYIASTEDDQNDQILSEDSVITINHLRGSAKEAATLLELTNTSTSGNPELVGLYYDQLASMLHKNDKLDKTFLMWLSETVTTDFQTIYVTENVCDDINDMQFSTLYNLNTNDEMETPLAVNIGELTLKSDKNSILTLSPHFRLLRLLYYKLYSGDLSSIDALLGCGVILPKLEQKDNLGIDQLKQMSDCIFHCINWFRETISGFVTQKNKKLRTKILQRLDNLNELEKILIECLQNIPEHKLPVSYFDTMTQISNQKQSTSPVKETTKRPRKKLKSKTMIVDDTTTVGTSKTINKSVSEIKITFREMDTDVVKLLKYPLNSPGQSSGSSGDDQSYLNINQLNFLLKDWTGKLELFTKGGDLGLSHLNIVAPSALIADCVNVLPNINKHLSDIIETFSDDDNKICFGVILKCLSLIFNWSGFQHSKRLDLLRDILKCLRQHDTSTPLNSVNHLGSELVNRLAEYTEYCHDLSCAVYLITTMEGLHNLIPNSTIRTKIAKTAACLLNKEWQKQNSINVDILVRSYLSSASIKTLCGMVGTLQEQAPELTNKSDKLEMLKSITKSNFYILYRNLWITLHDRVKSDIQSLTNVQHLTLWRTTALTMQGLMTVVKAQESKNNLACFLKKSIGILKIFLSHGIPILEIELKHEPDGVVEILKTIQSNTRFLHHLCCYSKVTKDASLMNYVPQFRLTLESLIYRVKAALVANGCSAAFWMGNLKNRDLQGEDILTQTTTTSQDNDEESEHDELPSDDDDEDDTASKSNSEVFE